VIAVAEEVASATAVVALETTLVAHGFPGRAGLEAGLEAERRVRAAGAVPATVAVVDGSVRVGLSSEELERIAEAGSEARKVGPRDLAACIVDGALGATTAGATLAVCRAAGVRFMATGGLGGVHRGFPSPPDISADLLELMRSCVLVVSAGFKSLLDVPATAEWLETLSIPLLGWRTDELPLFYAAQGGPPVSARVESVEQAATIARVHWELGRGTALVLARPPDESLDDVESLILEALADARARGVAGQDVTPFVLSAVHERSGGRTITANQELIAANAALAAEVAVAYSRS
jgi:pseudouridine-5'-phosphate glycosidase